MQVRQMTAGEGASASHFPATDLLAKSVVFCPLPCAGPFLSPEMVHELYRLALDMAVRSLRPSLYEQALHAREN